jgi:hypothetical protein
MKRWKVKYVHLEDREGRYPFFKRSEEVEANSRQEAIEQVKARFSPPRYGEYTASVVK